MRGEIHHGGFVERSQRVNQRPGRLFYFLRIAKNARAGIDHDRHACGLRRSIEVSYRPLHTIVENAEIFAAQGENGIAIGGRYDAGSGNHLRNCLKCASRQLGHHLSRWRDGPA